MKTTHWTLGLLAATLSLGLFTASHAQVSSYQQTTSTSLYPSVTTTTSSGVAVDQSSANLSGQVSSTGIFGQADEEKILTLTPGRGVFSIDSLAVGDRITMTLVNPTGVPLRFDTVQRLGQDYSWLVPANSQQTVSFIYTQPFSDEVKFQVYQDPMNAVAANTALSQQAVAASSMQQSQVTSSSVIEHENIQSTYSSVPASSTASSSVSQQQETRRSTVRGYW